MKRVILSVTVIISFKLAVQGDFGEVTPDVYSRPEILKQMVRDEIRQDQEAFLQGMVNPEIGDKYPEMGNDYEIITENNKRITPIMHDDRKIRKVKHKEILTTTSTATTKEHTEAFSVKPLRTNTKKKKKKSALRQRKPAEIFYRRDLDQSLNFPVNEIHCLDLLTPYLMGEKGNGTFKIITANDRIVLRVLQLISEDTSTNTKDEIYSLLYQMSTINIRLYQWDENAMILLFNQIIQAKTQTFQTLKRGIKRLLNKWHMDYGNVTNLLRQSRLFRPPCIQTSELTGSTRSSKVPRYSKSTTPKKICPPSDEDCY